MHKSEKQYQDFLLLGCTLVRRALNTKAFTIATIARKEQPAGDITGLTDDQLIERQRKALAIAVQCQAEIAMRYKERVVDDD